METNSRKLCAEGILKHVGLDWTRESVENDSLLSIAIKNPIETLVGGFNYPFTEEYFYHEFMFFWFSVVELESYNKFITKMKRICEVDLGPQTFDVQAIVQEMQNYCFLIPTGRMRAINIVPKHPVDEFESWYFENVDSIKPLFRDATSNAVRAVPERQNWAMGLSPRLTPYHDYLGAFADKMVAAVGGQDDQLFATSFELAILIKRQFMFGDMQSMLDDYLTQLGLNL